MAQYLKRYKPERVNLNAMSRSEVIAKLELDLGYRASWYTISKAMRAGLPYHAHPLLDRAVFVWDEVLAFLEAKKTRKVLVVIQHPAPKKRTA